MTKQQIYLRISSRADELIERLFELSKSDNLPVSLNACKTLLERVTPPLRGVGLFEVAHLDFRQQYETWKTMETSEKEKFLTRISDQQVKNLLRSGNGED